MTQLTGRRALVGGSTQGIGRACAEELAKAGVRVALLARNAEAGYLTGDNLPVDGGRTGPL